MKTYTYLGGCYCGNLQLRFDSTLAVSELVPRACDCRFCRRHAAAWISDAGGALSLQADAPQEIGRFRQGSESADFLLCRRCGVLCAVLYRPADADGRRWAALNSLAVDAEQPFPPAVPASPQRLGAAEKRERWQRLWIPQVHLSPGLL